MQSSRTPRRSRQIEAVDYSECERDTDSESETITSKGTLEGDQTPFKEEELEALGTPSTLGSHLTPIGQQYMMLTGQAKQRKTMAQKADQTSVEKMMELFLQMRQDDQNRESNREQDRLDREERRLREEQQREEKWEREEREREVRREERQLQLLNQLKEAQLAVPQQVHINQHKLPLMTEKDDIEIFLRQLEIALRTSKISQDKWKQHLLSQLTLEAKQRVGDLLEDDTSEYDEIKTALLGCTTMTFAAAAEAVFTADKGNLLNLPTRQADDKLVRWLEKMTEGTDTNQQFCDGIAMGVLKSHMVPDLKQYMDLTKTIDRQEFHATIDQWDRSQPVKRNKYKLLGGYRYWKQYGDSSRYNTTQGTNNTAGKKPLTCFACGKLGHMSQECRSRQFDSHKQISTSVSPQ